MDTSSSGHRARLRARFSKSSLEGMHSYEVLELLLTYAIPRRDVKPLAKRLLERFKSLQGVLEAPAHELAGMDGMGESSAVLVRLVGEAAFSYLKEEAGNRNPVKSPKDVVEFIRRRFGPETPGLHAVYLNSKNEILGTEALFDGEVKGPVPPRAAIEKAFGHNARSIIFVRNSRTASPFRGERAVAEELAAAAAAIDILVHDYIIADAKGHLSARELGWIKPAPSF